METQTRERAQGRDDGIETGTTAMGAACESRVPARVLLSSSLPCRPEARTAIRATLAKKMICKTYPNCAELVDELLAVPIRMALPAISSHCACIVARQSFSNGDVRDPRELEVAFVTEAHERESTRFFIGIR